MGKKSWCESDDAEFAAKAAEVVGLYLAPPENAIVICVDEKPSKIAVSANSESEALGLASRRSMLAMHCKNA
jgi:hypothetical protein